MLQSCTLIALLLSVSSQTDPPVQTTVKSSSSDCASDDFTLAPGLGICYAYFQSSLTFANAENWCKDRGGKLVEISKKEENDVIGSLIKGQSGSGTISSSWIGLTDQDTNDINLEGRFYWLGTQHFLDSLSYTSWAPEEPEKSNSLSKDCVVFTAAGWAVHYSGCESAKLPFVCQSEACSGSACTDTVVGGKNGSNAGVIAGIIVVLVVIAIIIVLLWYIYKFHNDVWQKYICCCCLPSKVGMDKLEQENQRLRHELSLRRTASQARQTSFSSNQFPAISPGFLPPDAAPAIPDGQGGMLPSIKPQGSSRVSHPHSPDASPPTIPALVRQTSGSGRSSVNGMVTVPGMPRPVHRPMSVSGPSKGPLPPFMASTAKVNAKTIKEEEDGEGSN
eukprot:m.309092 g.309092  ORF g.309092 m.309092 type:complete len:391 (+) comp45478_c0_seq1:659-1831(+)